MQHTYACRKQRQLRKLWLKRYHNRHEYLNKHHIKYENVWTNSAVQQQNIIRFETRLLKNPSPRKRGHFAKPETRV